MEYGGRVGQEPGWAELSSHIALCFGYRALFCFPSDSPMGYVVVLDWSLVGHSPPRLPFASSLTHSSASLGALMGCGSSVGSELGWAELGSHIALCFRSRA